METRIHPTAIVETGAALGTGVEIGAYAYIGARVTLGDRCRVHHHATVEGHTTLGEDNQVFPYALIGGMTHDLKFKGGEPGLRIGSHNVFREYVTVHIATNDGEFTVLGDHNVILAYSHVAHDCVVGNHLVMSSHAALAGHVVVGDHVNFGWGAGIHQFCRIGDYAMVAATAKLVQDAPPFMIVDGSPAEVRAYNKVGLERGDFSPEEILLVHRVFKILFREGLNRTQAIEKLRHHPEADSRIIRTLVSFIESSRRGIA